MRIIDSHCGLELDFVLKEVPETGLDAATVAKLVRVRSVHSHASVGGVAAEVREHRQVVNVVGN